MLKSIKFATQLGREARTLIKFSPVFRFSNSQSNVSGQKPQEEPKTADEPSKPANQFYYPIKRINFQKRDIFPIYMIENEKKMKPPTAFRFLASYFGFLAYGVSYIFFFDIYNYWHLLPLTYLFFKGCQSLFNDIKISGTLVRSVFLKKDGKTLIVTVPKSPVYYKYQEDIDLSEFGVSKNDIKITVDLDKVLSIGFLEVIQRDIKPDENFVPIKSDHQKQAEKQTAEALKEAGKIADENAEPETKNIIIMLEKDGRDLSLYINLDNNKHKAYNDYLVAMAQKKKIVMRETKEGV